MVSFTRGDYVCENESVIISVNDVKNYAETSNDFNAIHLDFQSAVEAGFEREIVHGMLVMGIAESRLSYVFPTSFVVSYETKFLHPVLVGELLTISYVVIEEDLDIITIKIEVAKENGKVAIIGVVQFTNVGG
ncbi:hypothetical protein BK128_13380 [Viridibacillus sp. FSL H7-0596]|uniref:MaoC family dehydratase n=1 Tax=Viridibacillus sp. FSL H7-0596 TaxID=1928923 RepID=UPI00096E3D4C|nr:MaoC/PaaZ C-terminal domain-containing protein [Viridibacillus sp. FSL H7-0596]OMC86014.1 hypothetical protein BK128_13380 [Viridibacillus sp. FSL H7-0596]